ncbi:MAG: phosphotransferase [Anaerolineae bacterium]
MTLYELPDFEQTIADLVLDMLRAPRIHPELILTDAQDARGEVPGDSVRLSYHYIRALLAYGFTADQEELADAAAWFASPFDAQRARIDTIEMNRLEALLNLRPGDDQVNPRLNQLIRQRTVDGYFDVGGSPDFDTLWALKVMTLAKEVGVLNGLMGQDDLKDWSGRIIRNNHRDKDMALALRLRYSLAGKFTAQQKRGLSSLMNSAKLHHGMWGLTNDTAWIAERMRQHELTPGEIADQREIFREMIISTCYVIENLMPLAAQYPEILPSIRQAMTLWWGVFHGKDAVDVLRALFPMPYDYLLIVSRALVSLRAYTGKPLIQWGAAHLHRQMAQQQIKQTTSPDHENIRIALRNWLEVDLEAAPRALRLGMSESNVVQVKPLVRNPMMPDDDAARLHIPYASSLVVKYGPVEEINKERENYALLPATIRDCFVRVPQASYLDEERRRAYVIMSDLSHYQTVYEAISRVPQIQDVLARELGYFLLHMHRGDARPPRSATWGLLWQLYLLPMQAHVERVFNYIRDNNLLDKKQKQPQANAIQRTLLDLIGNLVRYQQKLEDFPIAYMHGDLHTRNVMVRQLKRRRDDEFREQDHELDFKLIDLEKVRRDGDAALDAGELFVDLEIMMNSLRGNSDRRPIQTLIDSLRATYEDFAGERRDPNFNTRVQLARARAIIRVAKGRTKAGENALRESRRGQAISIAHEVLRHAEQAVVYLESVLKAFDE